MWRGLTTQSVEHCPLLKHWVTFRSDSTWNHLTSSESKGVYQWIWVSDPKWMGIAGGVSSGIMGSSGVEATAPSRITQDGTLVVKGENQTTLKQDPMRIQKTATSGNWDSSFPTTTKLLCINLETIQRKPQEGGRDQ